MKKALESDDIENIKNKKDALQEKAYALAGRVYEEQSKKNGQNDQTTNAEEVDKNDAQDNTQEKSNPNVEEAEFEEK